MPLRIRHLLTALACALLLNPATAAEGDGCGLRISLLTCSPGAELYSTFGHSALRITDSAAGTDIVYNYGVFDFGDPDFYLKFVRGRLLYYLDQQDWQGFLRDYRMEGRGVREQLLRMDCREKKALQAYLFEKIRPENRYYRYDFLFDNCTTRLRDLLIDEQDGTLRTAAILQDTGRTFRDHIHDYLDRNRMHWAKLGIDILLGSRIDRAMDNRQAMFLPDFLEAALDSTQAHGAPRVQERIVVLTPQQQDAAPGMDLPPTLIAGWLLAAALAALTYTHNRKLTALLRKADLLLFLLAGLLGWLLVLMWAATDHAVCRDNLNLLWALPTHAVAAFRLQAAGRAVRAYLLGTALLCLLLAAAWPLLPQRLNPALLPAVLALGWRAFHLSRRK